MRGVRFVELDASRRVTRHAVDQVNNNLTAQLLWCATHVEPLWSFIGTALVLGWEEVEAGWSPTEHYGFTEDDLSGVAMVSAMGAAIWPAVAAVFLLSLVVRAIRRGGGS